MAQSFQLSETLDQLHDNLLRLARLLERADVRPRPQVAQGWVDAQDVMNALHISRRTLQTLRENGTLGYTCVGQKFYYRVSEIEDLLRNNYVMFKLNARGKNGSSGNGKGASSGISEECSSGSKKGASSGISEEGSSGSKKGASSGISEECSSGNGNSASLGISEECSSGSGEKEPSGSGKGGAQ